ncbi:hypothetical protein [Streptomyces sp. SID5770]|uniref:hypothetical protein n=1 Tax=Streptomyces sp. SID5770 TaxID=2690308 RepID=UPI0031BAC9B3
MGRKKPGEPRRSRVRRQCTLRELAPPGAAYREWYQVRHGTDVGPIDDPRLRDEELDLPRRTARLGPLYENAVPRAAIGLDLLIDNAALPVVGPDGTGTSFPVENLVSRCRGEGPEEIRETVHRLHAAGVLLAEEGGEHDALRVRMVAERPGAPGGTWRFGDEGAAPRAATCVPDGMGGGIPLDVAATVAVLRSYRSQLRTPDPEEGGRRPGVNGPATPASCSRPPRRPGTSTRRVATPAPPPTSAPVGTRSAEASPGGSGPMARLVGEGRAPGAASGPCRTTPGHVGLFGRMVAFDRQVVLPPDGEVREDIGPAVLTVLSQGLRDETIARRLGVSLRTCRKYIADLFDLLGAESRFQAGYLTRAGNLLENTGDTPPGGIGE